MGERHVRDFFEQVREWKEKGDMKGDAKKKRVNGREEKQNRE